MKNYSICREKIWDVWSSYTKDSIMNIIEKKFPLISDIQITNDNKTIIVIVGSTAEFFRLTDDGDLVYRKDGKDVFTYKF
jgi:hypothetical protein